MLSGMFNRKKLECATVKGIYLGYPAI